MKKFKVLSIDAWSEGLDSWTWNNWFNVNTYDENDQGELTKDRALMFFYKDYSKQSSFEEFKKLFEIDDDQYNYVLIKKENQMPLLAIEYGSQT